MRFFDLLKILIYLLLSVSSKASVFFYDLQTKEGERGRYSLIVINTEGEGHLTEESQTWRGAEESLLRVATEWYIGLHQEKGSIPQGKGSTEIIEALNQGAERFFDGRSTFVLVVDKAESARISTENIRGMIRFSKASEKYPVPSFVDRLELDRAEYEKIEMRRGSYPVIDTNIRYSLDGYAWNHNFSSKGLPHQLQGDWLEIKSLGLDPEARVNFFSLILQFMESWGVTMAGGHRAIAGQLQELSYEKEKRSMKAHFFQRYIESQDLEKFNQRRIEKIGSSVFTSDYLIEVEVKKEQYEEYLRKPEKPRGIIGHYLGMGFQIVEAYESPDIKGNKTLIAKMDRQGWVRLMSGAMKREGAEFVEKARLVLEPSLPIYNRAKTVSQIRARRCEAYVFMATL